VKVDSVFETSEVSENNELDAEVSESWLGRRAMAVGSL
jgi:hypothetical protein